MKLFIGFLIVTFWVKHHTLQVSSRTKIGVSPAESRVPGPASLNTRLDTMTQINKLTTNREKYTAIIRGDFPRVSMLIARYSA